MKEYAIKETLDDVIILVPFAGLNKDDLEIRYKDNLIFIKVSPSLENSEFYYNKEENNVCHIYDKFQKQRGMRHNFDCLKYKYLEIDTEVKMNMQTIESEMNDGLLKIKIKKFEQSKKIEIK